MTKLLDQSFWLIEMILTTWRKDFEWFIWFQRITKAYFVPCENSYQIVMPFLQISDSEFENSFIHSTNLHPHGFLGVFDGNLVTKQWRAAVWFWQPPFNNYGIRANSSYF